MLVHQTQTSEGSAGNTINIKDRTVDNELIFDSPCHSGIRLGSDGVLQTFQANGGLSTKQGEWLVSGTASTFYVQRTIISGTLEVDAGAGFLQLNANRDYDNKKSTEGTKITVVFFEIADSAAGTNILDTATMTFISQQT